MQSKTTTRYGLFFLLLLGTFGAYAASETNYESDAMQVTSYFNNLTSISCDKSGQYCLSVGVRYHPNSVDHLVYKTSNGGINWNQGVPLVHPEDEDKLIESEGNNTVFKSVSCNSSAQDCVIAGTTNIAKQLYIITYTSHDGGESWSTPQLVSFGENDNTLSLAVENLKPLILKCESNGNSCILAINTLLNNQVHPHVYISQNGGESWTASLPINIPKSAEKGLYLYDLACDQSGEFCTSIGAETESIPYDDTAKLDPIRAYIFSTHDGGVSWSNAKPLMIQNKSSREIVESDNNVLNSISCDQSGLSCIALGIHYALVQNVPFKEKTVRLSSHAYVTKNGGLSWKDTDQIIPNRDSKAIDLSGTYFTAVDCDKSNSYCAAVGFAYSNQHQAGEHESAPMLIPIIYTSIDSGQTWQRKPFDTDNDINKLKLMFDVFCSEDAAICHAVGSIENT